MKKLFYSSAIVLALSAAVVACKKDDDTTPSTPTPATACNGKNLCMKLDGTQITHDAKWKTINSGRMRILWEEGSGATYKNIEIDIYGSTTGTYNVADKPTSGQADFQYYENSGRNISGQSGTVELTSMANNTLTGKFTITAKDQNGNTVQVTEGNFVNVPQ